MTPEVIIFDFDGVICDSVNVKTEAFALMYSKYGEDIVSQVVKFHHAHGGISRYEKFRHFHKEFLGVSLTDEELLRMGEDFSSLVLQKVIQAPYLSGVLEFIQSIYKESMLFICTGTPENEMNIILAEKGIAQYFKGVYGSPRSKTQIIRQIIKTYDLLSGQVEFYGDAMTDYNAAKDASVNFVGVYSTSTTFPDGTSIIKDFKFKQKNRI